MEIDKNLTENARQLDILIGCYHMEKSYKNATTNVSWKFNVIIWNFSENYYDKMNQKLIGYRVSNQHEQFFCGTFYLRTKLSYLINFNTWIIYKGNGSSVRRPYDQF